MDELLKAANKMGKVPASVVHQLLLSAEHALFACKMMVELLSAEQKMFIRGKMEKWGEADEFFED